MTTLTGLDVLVSDKTLQNSFKGRVALLSHNASVDRSCTPAALRFQEIFGPRFIKMFGPQHGFSTKEQDNMIETDHIMHPYFKIPVYSLYSETRSPTEEMLEGIDHFFIDLQDVGCRMYTYIYTLTLILEKCGGMDIEIIVLDRPNPLNGIDIEGNVLEAEFTSFIGLHEIPVRHALTIGEVGLMHQRFWTTKESNLKIIQMQGWNRQMFFEDTKLPWIFPSPNLPRVQSSFTFPVTVLFEGSNLSEGRGTTQSLEIVGHPMIESYSFYSKHLQSKVRQSGLTGFAIRPMTFIPTFHKFQDQICGGFQIHVTDRRSFRPWRTGQFLMREIFHYLGDAFEWLPPPYEYNYHQLPIDIINGSDKLRHWVEKNEPLKSLDLIESFESYLQQFDEIKLY